MTALLSLSALAIGYPARRGAPARMVARELDLEIRPGELVCLVGPNGAGKSTLLRTVAGVQPPLAGRIALAGEDLARLDGRRRARKLALVLTDRIAVGLLTARAVVELGRHPHTGFSGRLGPEDHRVVADALRQVGAEPLADRELVSLSDGEQQRVMIARALAQQPELLVLDEVTAFLDLPRRIEILALLRQLARERRCGVLLSIHDLDLALRHADRIWALSRISGDAAATLASGAPEDLVLSGELGRAFAAEGLAFDSVQGSFGMPRPAAAPARVVGEGLGAIWAARALERLGYATADPHPAAPAVTVLQESGEWRFTLAAGGERQAFRSLGELARRLEELPR